MSYIYNFIRKFGWVIGRRIYLIARGELTNNPLNNGEYWLLQNLFRIKSDENEIILMDIGANIGEWSNRAMSEATRHDISVFIHIFEPSPDSYIKLINNTKSRQVAINNVVVSNNCEDVTFYVGNNCDQTNSLYEKEGEKHLVQSITIDKYLQNHNIDTVDYIKSDTEGHDYNVLLGAEESLTKGVISLFQFEYNHRWVFARHFLKDVFDFISDKPYFLGRVHKTKIEIHSEWCPELERFFEANYVLINHNMLDIVNLSKFVKFGRRNIIS